MLQNCNKDEKFPEKRESRKKSLLVTNCWHHKDASLKRLRFGIHFEFAFSAFNIESQLEILKFKSIFTVNLITDLQFARTSKTSKLKALFFRL